MSAVFFYLGRTLQASGLILMLLVALWFFNPANGETRLLTLSLLAVVIFVGGTGLTRWTGVRE